MYVKELIIYWIKEMIMNKIKYKKINVINPGGVNLILLSMMDDWKSVLDYGLTREGCFLSPTPIGLNWPINY